MTAAGAQGRPQGAPQHPRQTTAGAYDRDLFIDARLQSELCADAGQRWSRRIVLAKQRTQYPSQSCLCRTALAR